MLEKTLESPLDCKEIKLVNPERNQSWIFIGRTDAEAPKLWAPDANKRLIRKDPDAGKDWRQEERGTTEDEMVGWHHGLNGHGFGWTLGVGDGQVGLVCWGSWGLRESDVTEQLNWTESLCLQFFLMSFFSFLRSFPHVCHYSEYFFLFFSRSLLRLGLQFHMYVAAWSFPSAHWYSAHFKYLSDSFFCVSGW